MINNGREPIAYSYRFLGIMEFTEDEKDYIAYIAERVMVVLSIELEKDIIIE